MSTLEITLGQVRPPYYPVSCARHGRPPRMPEGSRWNARGLGIHGGRIGWPMDVFCRRPRFRVVNSKGTARRVGVVIAVVALPIPLDVEAAVLRVADTICKPDL